MAELTVSDLFCPTTGISKCSVHINNIHKICIRPVSRAMHFNLYKFDYNPMIIVRLQKCSALFFFLYLCLGLFFPLLILDPLDFLLILCANTKLSGKKIVHFVLDIRFFSISLLLFRYFLTMMTAT